MCTDHKPQRPLNVQDRPEIPIPVDNLDAIIQILRTRGHFTHEAWGKCLATLETVRDGDTEPGVFPVLDAMEDAFQEVVTDLREISMLTDEAKEDASILLRPESDADEILLGRGKDEQGEPIERFEGVGKLFEGVLPQLDAFFATQNNADVVLPMVLEIIKAQHLVEEQGEGKWLQPLEVILGEALCQQISEVEAA
ncbi:hypothetical protein FBULB1_593 [Fusarium bulbicola]|nr:hypothetical protein FBULB1_593 [Fusarium bulbicola]